MLKCTACSNISKGLCVQQKEAVVPGPTVIVHGAGRVRNDSIIPESLLVTFPYAVLCSCKDSGESESQSQTVKSQDGGLFLLHSNRAWDRIEDLRVNKTQVSIRKYGRFCLDVKLDSILLIYMCFSAF